MELILLAILGAGLVGAFIGGGSSGGGGEGDSAGPPPTDGGEGTVAPMSFLVRCSTT